MIAWLLLLQAVPAAPPVLGAIGAQAMPASGCAAFLWSSAGDRTLVAMATANPARIRIALDGAAPVDIGWSGGEGVPTLGLMPVNIYKAGDVTVTLTLTITTRPDLKAGALVSQGTIGVERPGKDSVIAPVAGLVGCAS
jgi:hypothetical protein